jgi:uncharacterized protein
MRDGGHRLELVDALRGYALMGLFLVHMSEYFELYWADPQPSAIQAGIFALFAGKTFSLLALCFGFSFWAMMDGAARRGTDFSGRFAWRLALLAMIGWLHSLVYRGDIIVTLALAGFVLIPLHRIRDNRVLAGLAVFFFLQPVLLVRVAAAAAGAEWAVQPPHFWTDTTMPTYLAGSLGDVLSLNLWHGQIAKWWFYFESGRISQILGLFLIGLILGRTGFFAAPARFRRARRVGLAAAAGLAAVLILGRPSLVAALGMDGAPGRPWLELLLASWQELALTSVSALLIVALWQSAARPIVRPLVPVGRLTLTLYVGQSLLFVPVFYGFGLGLYDELDQGEALVFGLAAFALQAVLARLWLGRFVYGPLEWLWRAATHGTTRIPFRRPAMTAAPSS